MARPMPTLLLAILCALTTAVSAAGIGAEIVRLRDGTLVHGTILEFDEATGFLFERADTGGQLRLRWEHLPASEVARIKAGRGFTGEDPQPFLVDVVQLVLRNGTTETGLLVDDGRADLYTLRRRNGVESFPRQYVRAVETARVEGLAIHPPEELYPLVAGDRAGSTETAVQFQLAVDCEGAGLYERAAEHYALVRQLDPSYRAELIAARAARVQIKIEDKVETAVLDEIGNLLYKNRFEEAYAAVARFREAYPASRQLGELAALEAEIGRRRAQFYAGKIVSDYFSFLNKTLGEIARQPGMTLGGALELLDGVVHEEVLARLDDGYGIGAQAVAELWSRRSGGSNRTSSYGTGTFILGKDKALDWVGSASADEDEADSGVEAPADDADLQARIEEVLKKRQEEAAKRAASAKSSLELTEGITPDEWWAGASTDDRVRWLAAYYAEFGGGLSVLRAKPRNCRTCNALGTVEGVNEKNEVVIKTCGTCKGLKVERIVTFR